MDERKYRTSSWTHKAFSVIDCLYVWAWEKYYLEKDWFDNPTLISIEDAKKEVELL